jgi:very-short-patch-repair endonuclease
MRTPPVTYERAKALRRGMSNMELALWMRLRSKALLGLKFRRQHPVGPFILDFYCGAARLAVELDGVSHEGEEAAAYDRRRDEWIARQGIGTLRIPYSVLSTDLERVLVRIAEVAQRRIAARNLPFPPQAPAP